MTITIQQLIQSMPGCTTHNAELYLLGINHAFGHYDISSQLRVAHFLAQVGHKSASLRYCEEIASGSAYEGRADLGNIVAGDGRRFKGRGLIQITGRTNYRAYGEFVGVDFINNPILLASPGYATDSAGWYWNTHKLNVLADADDIMHITKRINGGLNGFDDRKERLAIAKHILAV